MGVGDVDEMEVRSVEKNENRSSFAPHLADHSTCPHHVLAAEHSIYPAAINWVGVCVVLRDSKAAIGEICTTPHAHASSH